jgi:hypothetical protein
METNKPLSDAEKALSLEFELEKIQSVFHTNRALRALFRVKDRPRNEVMLELMDALNRVSDDDTGKNAFKFVENITSSLIMKVHGIDITQERSAIKMKVTYVEPPMTTYAMPQVYQFQFPVYTCKQTEENKEMAMQIVKKIMSSNKRT